ncbi:hypothetical protein ACFLTY_04115 [Chloroflexota bacterium]
MSSRAIFIIIGSIFLACGIISFIVGMNTVGAAILTIVGIIGLIAGIKYASREDDSS